MTIASRALAPGSPEWSDVTELRDRVFCVLENSADSNLRSRLWRILAGSHHQFHRMILHGSVRGAAVASYRDVLVNDLTRCVTVLQLRPIPLAIEEATEARAMWSWYLEHGRDDDPLDQARQCEDIYGRISKWRLHDFFRFDVADRLAPETERVVDILRDANDIKVFQEFFDEAERYLKVERRGGIDGMDWGRISSLARNLTDQFTLTEPVSTNALTSFVTAVLGQEELKNKLSWFFAVDIIRNCHWGVVLTLMKFFFLSALLAHGK